MKISTIAANKKTPWEKAEICPEASYWHLPIIPIHVALQKVRD